MVIESEKIFDLFTLTQRLIEVTDGVFHLLKCLNLNSI